MTAEFFSTVNQGNLQSNTRQLIANEIKKFEGKRVHITIKKVQSTRSGQQNRYIHALFTIFTKELNELGNDFTMTEVKELCKAKFSQVEVVNQETGEVIGTRIKGTHEMSKGELNEFIEKVIRWAADMFSITLPYPNEEMLLNI
jgi:hypothetical protein